MEIYPDTITRLNSDPRLDLKIPVIHGQFHNLGIEASIIIVRLFGVRFTVGGETFLI
jgi:hypothetical protein